MQVFGRFVMQSSKKLRDKPKECLRRRLRNLTLTDPDFSQQELDPPEAVDLETTAKIKVPSQITQPDVSNDQTTVSIAIIKRARLSLSQGDSGIQNSSSYDWQLSSWFDGYGLAEIFKVRGL